MQRVVNPAFVSGNANSVWCPLDVGAELNAKMPLGKGERHTGLVFAGRSGNTSVASPLFERGPKTNLATSVKRTTLRAGKLAD